ncbi:MobA/MobL family protein [Roseobacteraceae bacterium S113]
MQRARGGNAVAAAAYRAGLNLKDEASQTVHRYAGRQADVEGAYIFSVGGAPDWHFDRAALWNSVEATEKRKDARTGRDLILGLAWELNPEERQEAVFEFAKREFVDRGYVVDIAFHKYGAAVRDGDRIFDQQSGEYISGEEKVQSWRDKGLPFLEAQHVIDVDTPHVKIERTKGGVISGHKIYHPHAHVLSSSRPWDAERGDWAAKKDPHFNKPETAMNWRYEWPKVQNQYLEAAGWDVRVSCTASAGDEALPTKSETLPNNAYHIERRGEHTTAQLEADFNRIQNEAVKASASDQEQTETGEVNETPRSEAATTGSWWRNMREHFTEARDTWRNHFSTAWDALKERWRGPELAHDAEQPPPTSPTTTVEAQSVETSKEAQTLKPRPNGQEPSQ